VTTAAISAPYLAFDDISMEFPGVKALNRVSFGVKTGEVHALMGENGAGKSTLLKVLSGVNTPTSGSIRLDGQPRVFRNAREALAAGLAVIYQELNLVPNMTVAENLMIGHLPVRAGLLHRRRLRERALAILRDLGEAIDPDTRVRSLPIGQRQMVEIGKALLRDAKVIAFDEPTSSLSIRETENLKRIILRLRDEGRAIIYVTHRMDEVFDFCDAVTVFRDGQKIETYDEIGGVTHDQLVTRMVGRAIEDIYGYRPRPHGPTLLEAQDVIGPGVVEPVSFTLKQGEILGFFGLVGAGRSELMKIVCGATRASGGTVRLDDRPTRFATPGDAIRAGIALCPEDRKQEGIFPVAGVSDNLNISCRRFFNRLGIFLDPGRETTNANRFIDRLKIKTRNARTRIALLSGGNQQKVIIARWLAETIKVLVMDEPTRGIDVGARSDIYSIFYSLAEQGKGIIVVSSDLSEVMSVCDRIAVMRQGRLVGIVDRANATPERLLTMALPT